jgi:hypothetical protein
MNDYLDSLLHQLLQGQRSMAKMHGESPDADFYRMVGRIELKNHGVRFLPAQVVNRSVRKLKRSLAAKMKGKS